MKKFNICLCVILCISLIICLISCGRSIYEMEQDAKRESIYNQGYEVGYQEGEWEGFANGRNEANNDFEWIIGFDAVDYAREYSGWHPEEAMCIIQAYEAGKPYGDTVITEQIYKDAVESLYRYCEYIYYKMYN